MYNYTYIKMDVQTIRLGRLLHLSPVIGTIALSSDVKTDDGRSASGISTAEAMALVRAAEGHLIDAFRLLAQLSVSDPALDRRTRAYLSELITHSDATLKKKISTKEGFHHLREAARLHLASSLGGELNPETNEGSDNLFARHVQSGGSFFGSIGHFFTHTLPHEVTKDVGGVFNFGKKTVSNVANDTLGDINALHSGVQQLASNPFQTIDAVSGLTQSVGAAAGNLAPLMELA